MAAPLPRELESVALGEAAELCEAQAYGIRTRTSQQFIALRHGCTFVQGRVMPEGTREWYHIRYHNQLSGL